MTECRVEDINNLLSVEDLANEPIRNQMLSRIYALTGCSMRSQKRLWKAFGEQASIKLFDKMDEFLNAANNLYALFDKIDDPAFAEPTAGGANPYEVAFEVYKNMMGEFVRSRNIWVRAYDKGLITAKKEAIKPKCGQPKKGFQYGDF